MLTIFTTPKPFEGHIEVIQRNAITSWTLLDEQVQVLMIGEEPGMKRISNELKVTHLPDVAHNEYGTPRLDTIFEAARKAALHPWLCYVNTDIILMDDLLPTVQRVVEQLDRFLIVGQRWDLDVCDPIDFNNGWQDVIRQQIESDGVHHPPAGSDYFIFPKDEFNHMPPFALGRAGWDNWMIFTGRRLRIPVIDASRSVTLIHQNHDYAHLPGGQPHYRLPESEDNVRLAGGRAVIFTLQDVDWYIDPDGLHRTGLFTRPIVRRLEAGLIARFGPGRPAMLVRMGFRPMETIRYYWEALMRRVPRRFKPGDTT